MIPSPWNEAIGQYVTYLKTGGAPLATVTTRRQHLQLMSKYLGQSPWTVSADQIRAYFGALTVATETRRSRRTTMRAFYKWGVDVGHAPVNVALAIPTVTPARPTPRATPDLIYATALVDEQREDVRLMLRLARDCGLRRGEVATGHSRNLIEDLEGWSLRVFGKGARERVVPLPDDLAEDLRALEPGWFFPGAVDGHYSARWVGKLVRDALPGVWTMHSLRHGAAKDWYDIDNDLVSVQDLLGHASPATTRVYIAGSEAKRRRLVAQAAAARSAVA